MSFRTFAAFSKIHLNTSKSTFMKVVQLVEGHNFHVDWHIKFWVEKHEKLAQRSRFPVHEHRLAFKVGKPPLQILLRKTLYSLFESDRGLLDLQFLYSMFGQLLFKILEIIDLKQGAGNTFGQGRRHATTSCASCAASSRPRAGCPRRPRLKGSWWRLEGVNRWICTLIKIQPTASTETGQTGFPKPVKPVLHR
jgi:hypothetical protein